jgi:hypothetical protein
VRVLHSGLVLYIEIDTNFEVVHPYCFIVPMAVVANCGLPLGFIITPTERSASYELFYDSVSRVDSSLSHILNELPLLSDQGSLLAKSTRRKIKPYFLHFQYVLEDLGSKTSTAVLARRLPFTVYEKEYIKLRSETTNDLKWIMSMGAVTSNGLVYFCHFLGLDPRSLRPVAIDPFREHALWGC